MVNDGDFPTKSRKVPPADSTLNFYQEEVVGNKTDAAVTSPGTTKSLQAYAKGTLNQLSSIITLLGQVIDVAQNVVSWSDVDRSVRFEISLIDKDSGPIASGSITEGDYVIDRFREGAIASFADAGGGDVTATTSVAHGLSNGETVTISGTTNYDGSYAISNVTANTFDFTDTYVATETGNWGAWQEIVSSTSLSKTTGLVYLDYLFENTDWATDDIYRCTPSGISVVIGGNTYYPAVTSWIGTLQDVSTIEGKIDTIDTVVDAIQVDVGDPSARINFQNIENMIGIPDAADSNLDDILRSGFDSSAITNNFDGAIMEIAKAGLEKDTAGAFDADTDSNEAIRDNMDSLDTTMHTTVDEIPSETNAKTFNATALASINAEVDSALNTEIPGVTTIGSIDDVIGELSHFLKLDGATQKYPENCATDSILAKVLVKADPAVPSQFDNSTDSLEAIRDHIDSKITDGVTDLGGGADVGNNLVDIAGATFNTATDSNEAISDMLQNGTYGLAALDTGNDAIKIDTAAIIADLDNATDGLGALKTLIDANQTDLDAIIVDTEDIQTQIGVAGAGLTAIPDMALDSTVAKEATLGTHDTDIKALIGTPVADIITDMAKEGADGDTLETLSDQIDDVALEATLATVDTVVDAIKVKTDKIAGAPTASSTNITDAVETTLIEFNAETVQGVSRVWIDLVAWRDDGDIIADDTLTFKIYCKVDGTNYREMGNLRDAFTDGTSLGDGLTIDIMDFEEDVKITAQSSRAPSAGVAIHYHYITMDRE